MRKWTIYEDAGSTVWKAIEQMIRDNGFNMKRPKRKASMRVDS